MKKDVSDALTYALSRGFQIHPNAFRLLREIDVDDIHKIIKDIIKEKTRQKSFLINQKDLEIMLGIDGGDGDASIESKIEILFDPTSKITTGEGIQGYNSLFASRFTKLKRIISNRPESKNLKNIKTIISSKSVEDSLFICGLVSVKNVEKNITKLTLEDQTGSVDVIIFEKSLRDIASMVLVDQLVMVEVVAKSGSYLVKELIVPDVPDHVPNRSKTEAIAVFLSDLHIGSKFCMEKELREFVAWLSSSDPKARKIRFIVIGGDVVDGVGIYRDQDKELVCKTIEEQLERTVEILSEIPSYIKIIITPGNHDPGRRALPQPAIPKKYNSDLWKRENIFMLGNPSLVSLNGVKVMIFHGQSIDDIVKTTPGLSYDKPVDVMRCLIRARHLCPIYGGQTPIAPELEDLMVIDDIPDIFHGGHVHIVGLGMYKGTLIINSGAWQKQTQFQMSVGLVPTPGFAILINLKTWEAIRYPPDN